MSVGPNPDQSSKGLNPIVGDEKSKIEKRVNPIQYYIKFSFGITYIFLLTTASITFVEALRTNNSIARHVFNLETAISLIAGYFYSVFLDKISAYEKDDIQIDWVDVTATRYIDWSLTTPLMLLVLCLVMAQNIGKKIRIHIFAIIAFLNYLMLYFGRLGDTQTITRVQACILGFAMFALMFALIFVQFVGPKYNKHNYILFFAYVVIWGLYGLVYLLNEEYKNIAMNILDCISKCFVGIGIWGYYSNILSL